MTATAVRVLSGIQPWWWIVLHLDKRVENRSRPVLGTDWRGDVLLHASKSKGPAIDRKNWGRAYDFVAERFGRSLADRIPLLGPQLPFGGIVGRVAVTGLLRPMCPSYPDGVDPRWHRAWEFGYLLADARETPFVRWRGWQSAVLAPARLLAALEEDPLS